MKTPLSLAVSSMLVMTMGTGVASAEGVSPAPSALSMLSQSDSDQLVGPKSNAAPIEVLKSVVLTKGDVVSGHGFLIRKSNITLDCNGQTIDGEGNASYGVRIDSQGNPISNITVKNCVFKNFKFDAINVGWILENYKKQEITAGRGSMYSFHPKDVLLTDNKYINSGNSGVYVNAYAQNVTIENSSFLDNQGVAIYLEYNSKSSRILNSNFTNNGVAKTREAIAIDSSTDNIVRGNVFDHNFSGGIFLYKNCGERRSLTQIPTYRTLGANRNLIDNNVFRQEKVGVWLAARQSHDLSKQLCADPSIFQGKYYQDYASDNKVVSNSFCGVSQAVIVEDDNNTIADNKVDSQSPDRVVKITNPPRAVYLNKPVIGTVVRNNIQSQCP